MVGAGVSIVDFLESFLGSFLVFDSLESILLGALEDLDSLASMILGSSSRSSEGPFPRPLVFLASVGTRAKEKTARQTARVLAKEVFMAPVVFRKVMK
jgi:hypothetical protein